MRCKSAENEQRTKRWKVRRRTAGGKQRQQEEVKGGGLTLRWEEEKREEEVCAEGNNNWPDSGRWCAAVAGWNMRFRGWGRVIDPK